MQLKNLLFGVFIGLTAASADVSGIVESLEKIKDTTHRITSVYKSLDGTPFVDLYRTIRLLSIVRLDDRMRTATKKIQNSETFTNEEIFANISVPASSLVEEVEELMAMVARKEGNIRKLFPLAYLTTLGLLWEMDVSKDLGSAMLDKTPSGDSKELVMEGAKRTHEAFQRGIEAVERRWSGGKLPW